MNVTHQPGITSQISHELRISLTGILGITHLLKKTTLSSQQKAYLKILSESAERLLLMQNKFITHFNPENKV